MAISAMSGIAATAPNSTLSPFKPPTPSSSSSRRLNVKSALAFRVFFPPNRGPVVAGGSNLSAISAFSRSTTSLGLNQSARTSSSNGALSSSLPAATNAFFGGGRGGPLRPGLSQSPGCKGIIPPNAVRRYSPFGFRYPEITEKPVWWWRTLACIPYLLALQLSDAGYYLHPFTERYPLFENLIFYIPGACNRLPSWFSMAYCFTAYLLIVKNKNLPHFFRFHLMMGMLLEVALQLFWYVSNFMPLIHYGGTFGVQYWAGVAFAFIALLLTCVRSALVGKYAEIPFLSESAYIHTLFGTSLKIGGIFG